MSKIVVVGANHAGTAAINTILDNYKEHEVVAIDSNDNISFLGCGMALWIGKQIDGPEGLFYCSKEIFESKGAKILMETKVDKVDFDVKKVYCTTKSGEKIEESYDKIILATGSVPIYPSIKGVELENVQYVKLYQNAREVIDKLAIDTIKHVTVVGAGYIGVELAEAFERIGKKVTVLDAADSCLTGYFDKEFRDEMSKNLEAHGLDVRYNQKLLEITGTDKVEGVITDKGEFATDMVVLAIGFRPNTPFEDDKLVRFKNGAYLVNKNQETSIKDVYAIGDCATIYDNAIQDSNYIALASNAVRTGIVAAHNAAGTTLESAGVQGSNGICIYGLKMVSTGITEERAKAMGMDVVSTGFEALQRPAFMKENEEVKVKIVYEKESRRIVGAQMMSRYDMSMGLHMFSLAIQEKVTIDKLKLLDLFFLPHFNQPYNYITMAALKSE